jgi:hypothetical protein
MAPHKDQDEHLVKTNQTCIQNGLRLGGMGGAVGGYLAFMDAFSHPVSSSVLHILGRAGTKFIVPGVFAGAVYGSTTCLLDGKRGKDKPLTNSLIGGCIAGLALGTKSHNPGTMVAFGAGFGVLAFVARAAFVGFYWHDEQGELEALNKELNMKRIAHLAPQQTACQ